MPLDREKLGKFVIEKSGGRDIYVYGAGKLAERFTSQMGDCGIPIKKIIITDGQPNLTDMGNIPIIYFSDFLKLYDGKQMVYIGVGEPFADAVMNNLDKAGVKEYAWPYRDVYQF